MAHELDTTDNEVSFANSRSDAWHRLGQSIGHTMTAREALEAAHLAGWNVRKMALQVPQEPIIDDHGVTTPAPLAVPDFYATVRTNPINGRIDVLGVVGSKYEPVQNEASCELLDALVDESGGAHYETAGALRGGRETFVTMKLPNSMVFDGIDGSKDRTDFYLAALNSHDGSSKFRFLVTPVRIVCANTQAAALGSAKASWGIRHTGGARAAISEARNALKLSWRYVESF
jgi:phage/plasmid-like protein (TIGR03299 family)